MSCKTCLHLNRANKQVLQIYWRYGCAKSLNGYIPYWLLNDNELTTCGCSDYKERIEEHGKRNTKKTNNTTY